MVKESVLLIAFNRPDTTRDVMEAIRNYQPRKLFIAIDGPRADNSSDQDLVEEVRAYCLAAVDWDCEVMTRFPDVNHGLVDAVNGAVDWFFDHVPRGIILEDDVVPHSDFFGYCEELLEKYEANPDVWCLIGDNSSKIPVRGKASYTFSKYPLPPWGVGMWKRAWEQYDRNLDHWKKIRDTAEVKKLWPKKRERESHTSRLNYIADVDFHTWDYPFWFSLEYKGGMAIIPRSNLISNRGIGRLDAAHPTKKSLRQDFPVTPILPLVHPKKVQRDKRAERVAFDGRVFGGKKNLRRYKVGKWFRKRFRAAVLSVKEKTMR